MAISSSLYSSISGLNTMGNAMSVLGDNVSNVNTVAFKSSRATFQDVLSQSVSTAAGSAQVGRGVTLSTVDGVFAQGSFESTSNPTDMAIGGQGFFMLRAGDGAEADMYSRAGEFRFDQEGNLINPVGYFVQGWTIDPLSGEVSGTIGDINLGKNTPPVATQQIEAIVNLDSREVNETNERRLYDAWDGRNAAAASPTDPIDSGSYEYTSAVKVYDSKGASHDITVYFDRTTNDNEWEFLVTSDPSEDSRVLTPKEQTMYAPNEHYNYNEHEGAGALMYGIVNFTTAGDINKISAWDVPPDGKVDISTNDNRKFLNSTDSYYSFDVNFTGAQTNQSIDINLGARYGGLTDPQTQVLVSEAGARSNVGLTEFITKETTWNSVYDEGGQVMASGDVISYSGYDHDGVAVSGSYVVDGTAKVSALLDAMGTTFGGTATIDTSGRLRLTDNTGGDSGMYVSSFVVNAASGSQPFGGSALGVNTTQVSGDATDYYLSTDGTNPATSTSTVLTTLWDSTAAPVQVANTHSYTLSGTHIGGGAAGPATFTVDDTVGSGRRTVDDLLNWLSDLYDNGTIDGAPSTSVRATLGADGRVRVVDTTNSGNLIVNLDSCGAGSAEILGPIGGQAFTAQASTAAQIDISSSKTAIVSSGRAFNTNSGAPPVITSQTTWGSVYDAGPVVNGVALNDQITFAGTKGDGTAVSVTYTVESVTDTVQDLLDTLENAFNADASIDNAGRLVLQDWVANEENEYTSLLSISNVSYSGAAKIFGPTATAFSAIDGAETEDGSREGDVVSTTFETEALASTQYANASTTIFQDQNGYAAGFLQSVSVDTDGIITGHYSNGQVLKKAQVALATFNNTAGLTKEGGNIFTETTDSGAPVTGAPGTNGLGSIAPNSLEQSNVDLGTEFVKLITTQRGFQANSKIITTTDEMLADLINIKR